MSKAQPFTKQDLERGEGIVRRLHGVTGFDNWAQLIAQELAAERERATSERDKAIEAVVETLEQIVGWQLPMSGRYFSNGDEMSYGTAFGSNGERDYMRSLTRTALSTYYSTKGDGE